jgi:TonB family protein
MIKRVNLSKHELIFRPQSRRPAMLWPPGIEAEFNWTLPSSLGGTIMQVTISIAAGGFGCSVAYQNTDMPWADPRCEMLGAALTREGRSFPVTMPESFSGPPAATSGPRTDWTMNDDYPIDALRNHWEGKSSFLLDIDANGHVTKCAITSSAGHKSLDDETCRIMTTRAHFSPAKGADGVTTPSHYASSIKWQVPNR